MLKARRVFKNVFKNQISQKLNNLRLFATEKSIDELQEEAYLTSKVIQEITKIRTIDQIKASPMTDMLLNSIFSDNLVDNSIKQKISQFFINGVDIPINIFDQKRLLQSKYKKESNSQTLKGFVYFPNHLVTGVIFRKIINSQPISVLSGHPGISKSISFQLYWQLSKSIVQYQYRTFGTNRDSKLKSLIKQVPKLIYWNLQVTKDTYKDVEKKFYNQFITELSQIELAEINQKETLFDRLDVIRDKFRQRKIALYCIIDQLNQLASLKKSINYEKHGEKKTQGQIFQRQLQKYENEKFQNNFLKNVDLKKRQEYFYQFKTLIQMIVPKFSIVIYLTSVNLQRYMADQLGLRGFLNNHSEIQFTNITFPERLRQQGLIYQLVDYFIFELGENICIQCMSKNWHKDTSISSVNLKRQLRDHLQRFLSNNSKQYQLTFLDIRKGIFCLKHGDAREEQVEKQLSHFQLKLNQRLNSKQKIDVNKLKEQFEEILSRIIKMSEEQLIKRLLIFRKQIHSGIKHQIIYEAFLGAIKQVDSQIDSQKFYIDLTESQLTEKQLKNFVDRRLFRLEDKKLYLIFHPNLYQRIMNQLINPTISYLLRWKQKYLVQFLKKNGFGGFFENLFIATLTLGRINMTLTFNNASFNNLDLILRFKLINEKKLIFLPIPPINIKKQITFLNNVEASISKVIQNQVSSKKQIENVVLLPWRKSNKYDFERALETGYYIKDSNQTSKSIDFILSQISYSFMTINLYAIDVTIDKQKIQPKIIKFIQEFCKFTDRNTNTKIINGQQFKVNLSYFVLSVDHKIHKFKQLLNQKFSNQLNFEFSNKKSQNNPNLQPKIIQVKNKDNNLPCLLNSVGYASIRKDIQIQRQFSETEGNAQEQELIHFFKYLIQDYQNDQKKRNQIKSNNKQNK